MKSTHTLAPSNRVVEADENFPGPWPVSYDCPIAHPGLCLAHPLNSLPWVSLSTRAKAVVAEESEQLQRMEQVWTWYWIWPGWGWPLLALVEVVYQQLYFLYAFSTNAYCYPNAEFLLCPCIVSSFPYPILGNLRSVFCHIVLPVPTRHINRMIV